MTNYNENSSQQNKRRRWKTLDAKVYDSDSPCNGCRGDDCYNCEYFATDDVDVKE